MCSQTSILTGKKQHWNKEFTNVCKYFCLWYNKNTSLQNKFTKQVYKTKNFELCISLVITRLVTFKFWRSIRNFLSWLVDYSWHSKGKSKMWDFKLKSYQWTLFKQWTCLLSSFRIETWDDNGYNLVHNFKLCTYIRLYICVKKLQYWSI